jgi:hypothetical protein
MTKIITFSPRFIVKNNMPENLNCRLQLAGPPLLLKVGETTPLYQFSSAEAGIISLRMAGLVDEW